MVNSCLRFRISANVNYFETSYRHGGINQLNSFGGITYEIIKSLEQSTKWINNQLKLSILASFVLYLSAFVRLRSCVILNLMSELHQLWSQSSFLRKCKCNEGFMSFLLNFWSWESNKCQSKTRRRKNK